MTNKAKWFVRSIERAIADSPKHNRCDQCEALFINGVYCHETGCPNSHSRYDAESGEWIRQRKCFECGCTVDTDDPCCSAPFDDFEPENSEESEDTDDESI
jgi:hypothetical protein